jgi:hypothetical protein
MAGWSYYTASYSDPGTVEWHHFRKENELRDLDDRDKWTQDDAYRRKKETQAREDPESV